MLRPFIFLTWTTVFLLSILSEGKTSFSTKEDEKTCKDLKFKKVSIYRRVSTEEMSRKSADSCCKLRGMTLYTTEKVDEPTGFIKEFKSKVGGDAESKWFWISANSARDKTKFRWEYGTYVNSKDLRSTQWDKHEWDKDEPQKTNGRCASSKAQGDKMVMKVTDCEESLSFICEMEPQKGGKDLTVMDIAKCQQSLVEDIPGYPSLKIFENPGRWTVANLCCQSRGWALVDNVVRKGTKFHSAVFDHKYGLPVEPATNTRIWTSGNDLCEFRKWKWACGESAGGEDHALSWLKDEKAQTSAPDNLLGMENCLEYSDDEDNPDAPFMANDVSCDAENIIICESNPRCSVPEQYPCATKDPRTYDLYDTIDEDAATCSGVKFTEENTNMTSYPNIIFVGDKMMSWVGAMACCEEKSMTALTLLDPDDKAAINHIMKELAKKDPKKEYRSLWTSSSNIGKTKRAPLAWPSGVTVEAFMFNKIKLHSPLYPTCGKVMFLSGQGSYVVTAQCTEPNYVVCMKRNESFPVGGSEAQAIISHADSSQKDLYAESLKQATEKEKEYNVIVIRRDKCPNKFLDMYHEKCSQSSSDIGPYKKPKVSLVINDDERFKIFLQNKRMLNTLILDGVVGFEVPNHAPKLGFKLLATSVGLYSQMCPIVPTDFLQSAFRLFHDLHWSTSQGRTDFLKKSEYKWISKLLRKCTKFVKPIHARTENCGEEFIAVDNCTKFVCTSPVFEFHLYRTDPLVDMMWKVYEMIHSLCFPSFEESYRMYHKYAQAMMDLWSPEIKLRWFNQLADDEFWLKVLGPAYDVHLVNMERCNHASISRAFFHIRLPRNTIPDRVRILGGNDYRYKDF